MYHVPPVSRFAKWFGTRWTMDRYGSHEVDEKDLAHSRVTAEERARMVQRLLSAQPPRRATPATQRACVTLPRRSCCSLRRRLPVVLPLTIASLLSALLASAELRLVQALQDAQHPFAQLAESVRARSGPHRGPYRRPGRVSAQRRCPADSHGLAAASPPAIVVHLTGSLALKVVLTTRAPAPMVLSQERGFVRGGEH